MAHEQINPWWMDKDLIEVLKKRQADLNSCKDKGISWEEAKKRLLNRGKKLQQ